MRNRRGRRFNEDVETRKLIYISVGVTILAILTFLITYVIYSNILSKEIASEDITKLAAISSVKNEEVSETNSNIGKSVNETITNQEQEEKTKIAINTSNIEQATKANTEQIAKESADKQSKQVEKQETTQTSAKVEKVADPTFIKPVEGEIIKEFAKESLVYSETLREWITHTGIDIKAEKTTIVKASADGNVKSIKNDPRYGITVIIEHVNGFTSVYSNLLTAEFVKEGEKIRQGQTIGTVGNTATFEILDDAHLHFEILKDNEYLNPSEYIK